MLFWSSHALEFRCFSLLPIPLNTARIKAEGIPTLIVLQQPETLFSNSIDVPVKDKATYDALDRWICGPWPFWFAREIYCIFGASRCHIYNSIDLLHGLGESPQVKTTSARTTSTFVATCVFDSLVFTSLEVPGFAEQAIWFVISFPSQLFYYSEIKLLNRSSRIHVSRKQACRW